MKTLAIVLTAPILVAVPLALAGCGGSGTAAPSTFTSTWALADKLHCSSYVDTTPAETTDTTVVADGGDDFPTATSTGTCTTSNGVKLSLETYASRNDRQQAEMLGKLMAPGFMPADARLVIASGSNIMVTEDENMTTSDAGEKAIRDAAASLGLAVSEIKK